MSNHQIYSLLKHYFGYSEFKKGQKELITKILKGQDVFGIMPTGAGKSVCYQIPALVLDGVSIVISPLISLMKDQVDALKEMGIKAAFINSSLSTKELNEVTENVEAGEYKLIYVAPERLVGDGFLKLLKSIEISLIAIDEAHCVSQWGHDFRPSYTRIAYMVRMLKKRPVIAAFTATATPQVQEDIIKLLELSTPFLITTGFDRANLHFGVVKPKNKFDYLIHFLQNNRDSSGLIYCSTRKTVESLNEKLLKKGFNITKYHAGLSENERTKNQDDFIFDRKQIMVATNAFGMGIDKSNIRFVLHYNMTKNMEAYYQEAGRAGRDGLRAECILLYGASDIVTNKFLIERIDDSSNKINEYRKLNEMIDYCNTDSCLRKYILRYFGEKKLKDECSNCSSCNNNIERTDITIEAQKIMSCIKRVDERFGAGVVVDVLKGANTEKIRSMGFDKISTYGIMKEYDKDTIKEIISYLVAENYIRLTGDKYPILTLNQRAYSILKGKEKVSIKRVIQKMKTDVDPALEPDSRLFEILRAIRRRIAETQKIPPFVVFSDASLRDMSKKYPVTEKDFINVFGVGENKLIKYGDDFISAIKSYVHDNGINIPENTATVQKSKGEKKLEEPKKDTRVITYELYKSGYSIDKIMEIRELTRATIENHLIDCLEKGLSIDTEYIVSRELQLQIIEVIKKNGTEKLKQIKALLPQEVSYGAIKFIISQYSL